MATKKVELRQKVNNSFTDEQSEIVVRSDWDIIDNKPDTFVPTDHNHDLSDLNATGNLDNTTYLRGDGQWVEIATTIALEDAAGDGIIWDNVNQEYDVEKATTLQAEAGVNDTAFMTPLKTAQAIEELGGGGATIFKEGKTQDNVVPGDLAQFAGSEGDHYLVKKAVASEINANPDLFMGVFAETAAINDFVKVMWVGLVENVNLPSTTYSLGDILWYDNTNASYTLTEPTTKPIIQIAAVTKVNDGASVTGRLLVRPQFKSRNADEVFMNDNTDLQTKITQVENDVPVHVKGITTTDISNWDTAYGWGDHASEGYLTSLPSHTHAISDVTGLQTALDGKATPADITTAVSNLVDSSPAALDTLNELAAALDDDPNFATTVTNSIGTKVSKSGDTMSGALTIYQGGQTALKTYSAFAGTQIIGYQSDSGSPYTKTTDIVANGDVTVPSQMRFFTKTNGDSSPSERIKIDSIGNVGIGTTTPDAKLHIYDTSGASEIFLGEDAAADKSGILKYNQGNGTGTGTLQFGHWGDNLNTNGITIKKGGNVGIGTASPSQKLDVNGNAKISGDLRVDGSVEIGGDLEVVGNSIGFINTAFDAKIEVDDGNPNGTGAVFNFFGDGVSRNATISAEQFDGNAATATKWTNARTLSLTGDVTGSTSFDGSNNASITVSVLNDSHTHDTRYVQKSGDTMSGNLTLDGHLKQANYYKKVIGLPNPAANSGAGRWFVRLWQTSAGATFSGGKIRTGGTWNYASIMGHIEIDYGVYVAGSATSISAGSTRFSSGVSRAYDNLRIGDIEVVNGYVGFYVWAINTNSPYVEFDIYCTREPLFQALAWESNALPARRNTELEHGLDVSEAATISSDAASRVLYLKQNSAGTGNIIQFVGPSNENTWEVVGRDNNFYIYNNDLSKRAIFIEDSNNRIGINNNANPSYELDVAGSIRASSNMYVGSVIYHDGDTNTYTQFHANDQWRVVTGGGERLEVNNSAVTVSNKLVGKINEVNNNVGINFWTGTQAQYNALTPSSTTLYFITG